MLEDLGLLGSKGCTYGRRIGLVAVCATGWIVQGRVSCSLRAAHHGRRSRDPADPDAPRPGAMTTRWSSPSSTQARGTSRPGSAVQASSQRESSTLARAVSGLAGTVSVSPADPRARRPRIVGGGQDALPRVDHVHVTRLVLAGLAGQCVDGVAAHAGRRIAQGCDESLGRSGTAMWSR